MCGMPWVVRVMETVAGGSGDAEAAVANKDVINTSVRGQSGDIGHLGSPRPGMVARIRLRSASPGTIGPWSGTTASRVVAGRVSYLFDFIDILAWQAIRSRDSRAVRRIRP